MRGGYQFWLDFMQLPVAPSSITFKTKNKNETVDLINESEVNLIKPPGLTDISFEYEIPSTLRAYEQRLIMPEDAIQNLENFKNQQKPFYLRIVRMPSSKISSKLIHDFQREVTKYGIEEANQKKLDLAMVHNLIDAFLGDSENQIDIESVKKSFYATVLQDSSQWSRESGMHTLFDQRIRVTLEDYEWSQDADKHGEDFIIKVNLKTYQDFGTKVVNFSTDHKTATITQTRAIDDPPTRFNYTVIEGNTLWDIAKIKLGDGELMYKIYEENKEYIKNYHKEIGWDGSEYMLFVGMVLQIPAWDPSGNYGW